jgi:hypothetical protein
MVEWALSELLLDGVLLAISTMGLYGGLVVLEELVPHSLRER